MIIEQLSVDNLREGVFCARGKPHGDEMYSTLEAWLDGNMLRGLLVRAADGEPAGFILYYPIEHAPLDVEGDGLYVSHCMFVKPDQQGNGFGRALIEAAIADARDSGASGLAMEGFREGGRGVFSFVPGTFLKHVGLAEGPSRGMGTLYYTAFRNEAEQPRYMEPRRPPSRNPNKVRIDIFDCRNCYIGATNREVVKAVMERLGEDRFELAVSDYSTRQAVVDRGMPSGVFVDGALTFFRGPISEDDVLNALEAAWAARKADTDRG